MQLERILILTALAVFAVMLTIEVLHPAPIEKMLKSFPLTVTIQSIDTRIPPTENTRRAVLRKEIKHLVGQSLAVRSQLKSFQQRVLNLGVSSDSEAEIRNDSLSTPLKTLQSRLKIIKLQTISKRKVVNPSVIRRLERRGKLVCNGVEKDSEVVYWKIVHGDNEYESPITPHHHEHNKKFLSFRYDPAGFNNIRLTFESLVVASHAMGRTIVFPPNFDHNNLLRNANEDERMGFQDLITFDLLRSQKGFHSMTMDEFLNSQLQSGKLRPNDVNLTGNSLYKYLESVADHIPGDGGNSTWNIRFLVFPDAVGDFRLPNYLNHMDHENSSKRLEEFFGRDEIGRAPILYDDALRKSIHIHIKNDFSATSRILQQHYAFTFFADPKMASFYKRFVRDFIRYNDEVFCTASELIDTIRKESRQLNPMHNGDYYAMHIRRGDIHMTSVKISAAEIVENLKFPDGSPIIPRGAYVYIATDDPDGICAGCRTSRNYMCPRFNKSAPAKEVPHGCILDPTWTAFTEAGWNIRFLRDFKGEEYLHFD